MFFGLDAVSLVLFLFSIAINLFRAQLKNLQRKRNCDGGAEVDRSLQHGISQHYEK